MNCATAKSRATERARVALVFPRLKYRTGDPPLGLAYLAAYLRRERPAVAVQIIDGTFMRSRAALLDAVRGAAPRLVGVYTDSLMTPDARAVAAVARAQGAVTIAGGPLASVAPLELVDDFDAVAIGEGEQLLVDVVDRVLAGAALDDVPGLVTRDAPTRVPGEAAARLALDALPFPAWDLLEMQRYVRLWPYLDCVDVRATGTNVIASRGCPWQCTYCQPTLHTLFGAALRQREPEGIAEEIARLQRGYGVRGVFFHDDTFTAREAWLTRLCESLRRLPRPLSWGCNSRADRLSPELCDLMIDSGMRTVHIGIEAGSERVREEILGKSVDLARLEPSLVRLRQRGAHALGFFMLGSPTETLPELLETLRLARRLPLSEATFSLTAVLPGTHLRARLAADPRFELSDAVELDYYNRRNFTRRAGAWEERSLRLVQLAALAAFYAHPQRADYLVRHATSSAGLHKLLMKTERFLAPLFGRRFSRVLTRITQPRGRRRR